MGSTTAYLQHLTYCKKNSKMEILRQSIQSYFSHPPHKTALEFGSRPILQSVQKSRELVGLHNFCSQSCLEAMLICNIVSELGGVILDLWEVQILKLPIPSSLWMNIQPVPIKLFLFVITLFCTGFSKYRR